MPRRPPIPDHYDILGIPPTATFEEIHAAYELLSRNYLGRNPDVTPSEQYELFRAIEDAYHILSNPQRRQEYDAARSAEHCLLDTSSDAPDRASLFPPGFRHPNVVNVHKNAFGGLSCPEVEQYTSPSPQHRMGYDAVQRSHEHYPWDTSSDAQDGAGPFRPSATEPRRPNAERVSGNAARGLEQHTSLYPRHHDTVHRSPEYRPRDTGSDTNGSFPSSPTGFRRPNAEDVLGNEFGGPPSPEVEQYASLSSQRRREYDAVHRPHEYCPWDTSSDAQDRTGQVPSSSTKPRSQNAERVQRNGAMGTEHASRNPRRHDTVRRSPECPSRDTGSNVPDMADSSATEVWRPNPEGNPGTAYRDLFRREGEQHTSCWSHVGTAGGAGLGLVVGGIPGAIVGGFAGNQLGAIRDAKGKPVLDVWKQLSPHQRAEILKDLAITPPLGPDAIPSRPP